MKMERLIWDSSFFDCNVFALYIDGVDATQIEDVYMQLKQSGVDVAYVFLPEPSQELHKSMLQHGAVLYDRKITYAKILWTGNEISASPEVEMYIGDVTAELESLVYAAGAFSRFRKDPKFCPKFKTLYTCWITNALNSNSNESVFVIKEGNKITGMVTCKIENDEGKIGLIAIADEVRRSGKGMQLMASVEDYYRTQQVKSSRVITQLANSKACGFYEKCGYSKEKIEYVYHWWITR